MHRRSLFAHFLLLLILCAGGETFAVSNSGPLPLRSDASPEPLAGHLHWYRDAGGQLGAAQLAQLYDQGKMTPAKGYPSFGYTRDTVWARFELTNQGSDHSHFLLTVAPAFLDHIQLFKITEAGPVDLGTQGDRTPWSGRLIPWRNALYEIALLPSEQATFYLRVKSHSSIAINPQLWQPGSFASASSKEMLLYGLLIATGSLTCLLSLFFFSLLRHRIYLYFFLYVLSFTFVIAQLEGVIHFIVSPATPMHLEGLQVVFQSIGLISMTLLFSEIAELGKHLPRINRALVMASSVIAVAGLIFSVLGKPSIAIPLVWVPIALLGVITPVTTFLLRQHIGLVSYLYTAAFAAIGVFTTIRFIWVFGAIEPNIFSENNFSIAMLMHAIVLFITLAAKYLQLEKSLMHAKDMALKSIQKSERRLETLVQQRTTDLDDANRKLAEQLQVSHSHASALEKIRDRISTALEDEKRASLEQKRFLRMVAHEFRTPLSVIQMASSIIRADPRTPDVHATTNCDRIEVACERMASLINQALREDKLDSAIWRKNAAFIPVVEILQAVVSYGEMISAGRHPISFRCEDELIFQGDHELLVTMLNNIVDNAVKYSPAGSEIQVEASSSPTGSTIVSVHDKGRGMSPEEVKQVLQKYFRADGTQDIPGMGLGLYLVDQISRLHNATISIESAKGQGTTFVLTFPEASADKEEKS